MTRLSELLIQTADVHLAVHRTNGDDRLPHDERSPFICDSVRRAADERQEGWEAIDFLNELGMGNGFHVFDHIPAETRQATRFDFLNLAALLADDLNINVGFTD